MKKNLKKPLLQGFLGVMVFLVSVFFFKPLVWLLISAAVMLLSFILAQGGRGREQWVLLPLIVLSLGVTPRLWGDMLPLVFIPWLGGIVGMAVILASIKEAPVVSLPRLFVWAAGLCVLLIWGEYPQIWPLYFLGGMIFGVIAIALIFIALGRELRQGGVAPLLLVPMALIAQTLVVWTLGSFLWILVSGGIALLGFIAGLLWESRAEIRKKIQDIHNEVMESWSDFFSASRDEQ